MWAKVAKKFVEIVSFAPLLNQMISSQRFLNTKCETPVVSMDNFMKYFKFRKTISFKNVCSGLPSDSLRKSLPLKRSKQLLEDGLEPDLRDNMSNVPFVIVFFILV